jgi:hypothetical protein
MVTPMRLAISNPEKILRLLDSKLTKPMELTIYGRAALALGFAHPKADFLSTKDVDAVIPITVGWMLFVKMMNLGTLRRKSTRNWNLMDCILHIFSPMPTSSYGLIGQNIEFQSQWIARTFAFIDLLR